MDALLFLFPTGVSKSYGMEYSRGARGTVRVACGLCLVMTRCEHHEPNRKYVRLCIMRCSYLAARWRAKDVHVAQIRLFGGGWVRLEASDI